MKRHAVTFLLHFAGLWNAFFMLVNFTEGRFGLAAVCAAWVLVLGAMADHRT